MSSNTGMIAQRGHTEARLDKNEAENSDGQVGSVSYYNPLRTIELSGIWLGGVPVIGSTYSVAINLIGNPTGSVYLETLSTDESNADFVRISTRSTQYYLF